MPERKIPFFMSRTYKALDDCDTVIVGIDPGVTTGLSVIAFRSDNIPMPADIEHWGSDQISYGGSGNAEDIVEIRNGNVEQEICDKIAKEIHSLATQWRGRKVIVAIEDFIVRQQNSTREFLAPVRITAGIVQEIYRNPNVKIVYQTPADGKGVCTDARMDKWGYTIRTQKDRHSRDADRHAILCLRRILEKPSRLKI